MSSRTGGWVRIAAMGLVSLVVAHDLVFLAGFGPSYGAALLRTGHSTAWSSAVITVLIGAVGCVLLAARQLRRLAAQAGASTAAGDYGPSMRTVAGRWVRLSLRLTALTAAAFVVQENAEHLASGEALPGLGTLGSVEYPNAIWIIALVAFAVGLVGALFGWRFERLVARIRAVRPARRPPAASRRAPLDVDRRPLTLLGSGIAGRAPPAAAIR
jgi:hypothetical protein